MSTNKETTMARVVSSWRDVTAENALPVILEICTQKVGLTLTLVEASILYQAFEECEKRLAKQTPSTTPVTKPSELTAQNYAPVLKSLLDAKVRQGFGMLDAAMLNQCLEFLRTEIEKK